MSASRYYRKVPKDILPNLDFRRKIVRQADTDDNFRDDILEMCRQDILLFVNAFTFIFEPRTATTLPFLTYGYQDETLLTIQDCIGVRDMAMFKSRDMGASWMACVIMLYRWLFFYKQSFLTISRKEELVDKPDDPKSMFWKIDFLFDRLPVWMKPRLNQFNRSSMHFFNPETESVIDGESTTETSTVGDRRLMVVADEFQHFPDGGYPFMQKSRDVTASRLFIFTPHGTGSAAHEIVTKSKALVIPLHWTRHPDKSKGLYESDGKRAAPDFVGKKRSPWYDAQCERALHPSEIASELDMDWLGSAWQYFSEPEIRGWEDRYAADPHHVGDLAFHPDDLTPTGFSSGPSGNLRLWFSPDMSGNPPPGSYTIGCDISMGTGETNSAASVTDCLTGEKVAELVTCYSDPRDFAHQVIALCRWFYDAYLIWEANGPGGLFGKHVIDEGYSNFYYRRDEESAFIKKRRGDLPGWWSDGGGKLKKQLADTYRVSLHKGTYLERSRETLDELRYYVADDKGIPVHNESENARNPMDKGANHGDRAIAAWLSCWASGQRAVKDREIPRVIPRYSIAWMLRESEKEQRRRGNKWWSEPYNVKLAPIRGRG